MNGTEKQRKKPALLAPAGTEKALDAAIAAGADAVYFGTDAYNARLFADNFAGQAAEEAIRKCAFFGVASNLTLNTMCRDGELTEALRTAERLLRAGADALIVADTGLAAAIHRAFPQAVLHASTQCGGHSVACAESLAAYGFSRMVAARELPQKDLLELCRNSPIETELFCHGALCVSRSGSCLFSAMVGGRSGNRGACAQPCRLPAAVDGCKDAYALSLKDLCLAGHMSVLAASGAAALKIEGRMKSPVYVYGVTKIYRRLLDEARDATAEELQELAALFSRGGMTDAYYRGTPSAAMGGIRGEDDKANTARAAAEQRAADMIPRRTVQVAAELCTDKPVSLRLTAGGCTGEAFGPVPQVARTAPLSREQVKKQLLKLGDTPFRATDISLSMDAGLMLPLSALNELRRRASTALAEALSQKAATAATMTGTVSEPQHRPPSSPTAERETQGVFMRLFTIPQGADAVLDRIFLPLDEFLKQPAEAIRCGVNGIALPWTVFDTQQDAFKAALTAAKKAGVRHALVENAGQFAAVCAAGLVPHGGIALNIWNGEAADAAGSLGALDYIASPELTVPQLRALSSVPKKGAVSYGRLPLMHLERCIMRTSDACKRCADGTFAMLRDRRGASFPVFGIDAHRNLLFNSVPTYLLDQSASLRQAGVAVETLWFTTETRARCAAILRMLQNGTPPDEPVRRMGTRCAEGAKRTK